MVANWGRKRIVDEIFYKKQRWWLGLAWFTERGH